MNWEPLGFIGLIPLFVALEGASYRRVFWCAWLFGLVTNIGGFPWITELLIRFGNLHWGLALVLHLLLGSFQALMFPVAALGATWLRRARVPFLPAWIAGFLLTDYVFPMIFPWYLAMSQHRFTVFIQVADLVGVVGVTSLVVAINAALYLGLMAWADRSPGRPAWLPRDLFDRRELVWSAAAVGAATVATLVYGFVLRERYHEIRARADKVPFGLVQPDIGIRQKRDPAFSSDNLDVLQRMTAEAEARGALVAVWPEASFPYALPHDPPPEGRLLRDRREGDSMRIRRGFSIPLVFGSITRGTNPPRRYNSSFVLDGEGLLHGPVDKNVLLMFGEYIPLRDQLGFLDRWFPRAGSLAAGSRPELLPLGSLTLGILNCYEDILPRYVGRLMRAGPPNVLVNITNDAWFGDSAEPYQHLALAVFRSVEQRREMVRAVNTGVSAHVAATGELLWQSSIFVPALHVAEVVPYAGRTVYSIVGDWPGYGVLVAIVAWAAWRRLRRPRYPVDRGAADRPPGRPA
ncbi:MAG: apolipoprotein N-acyltransferase [Deltaproteobacteria bacterium]|nr:apolipoprotein N-acyltransferase [Deltaproteobacteria bacterium]